MLVYANTLNLPAATGTHTAILGAVDTWLLSKTRNVLAASAYVNRPSVRLADGKELEVTLSGDGSLGEEVLGSVVFAHPDSNVHGRKWFTRIGFRIMHAGLGCSASVVLETSDISVQSGSSPVFATRPGVVLNLVQQCGLIKPSPEPTLYELTPENADALAVDVYRPDREYAIILLTKEPFEESYYAQPPHVLDQVVGLARVVTIPNKAHTRAISEILGRRFSAWNGAINIIMPPLRNGHIATILIDADQLRYETGRDRSPDRYLLYRLTHRLNLPNYRQEITAGAVRQHSLNLRLSALKAEQQSNEQLQQMLDLLQSKLVHTEAEISRLKDENAKAWAEWEEADQRSAEVTRLKSQIATYREAFKAIKTEGRLGSQSGVPITSVADAIEAARTRFAGYLVFSLNSKSDGDDSLYEEPEDVLKAFEWLATVYFGSRTGKTPCPDLDKNLAEAIPGWHYTPHQKEATMKAHKEWYQCPRPGATNEKLWIPEHLKGGAARSRRPEEAIRIAFTWEPAAKKVVIGFIGQHQENSKS